AGTGTAAADGNAPQAAPGGVTAQLNGLIDGKHGTAILDGQEIQAGLFGMTVDGGGTLQTYCIDIKHHTQSKAKYKEVAWDQSTLHGNQDAGKIRWILQHSYPQINDFALLTKEAGAETTLNERTAAAGTQVAIWRLSDKANVEAKNPAAEKLADYLVDAAQDVAEPAASLKLDSPAVSGKAGHKLGPVTVHTNADSVTVTPAATLQASGVKVVDETGAPATTAKDGSKLFFDVPKGTEPGSASVTLSATTEVAIGRAFAGVGDNRGSQTQILAGSSSSTVTATATAKWADEGPIPAVTAEKDCAEGGVDLNVSNQGDETFVYTVNGERHELAAGKTETVTVPVKEDASYSVTVKGEKGFSQTFSGVLDCKTTTTTGDQGTTPQTGDQAPADDHGTDLAETGSSGNSTLIAGIAIALVVVGGGAMLIVRKRKPASAGSNAGDSKE
ncbi:MAG TPA: thioester domain-containing protein, partial [Streptomyces sp.]|nr:thioester domain-containing protein [Streptomyces sp.]